MTNLQKQRQMKRYTTLIALGVLAILALDRAVTVEDSSRALKEPEPAPQRVGPALIEAKLAPAQTQSAALPKVESVPAASVATSSMKRSHTP